MASLVERVLAEWQIQHTMIHRILTANGSTMVAALKHEQVYESDGELGEDTEDVEEERSNSSVIQANVNVIEDESCDEGQESGETAEEDIETPGQRDIDNFEECENNHSVAFVCFNRTRCFAHTLQLVI